MRESVNDICEFSFILTENGYYYEVHATQYQRRGVILISSLFCRRARDVPIRWGEYALLVP